MFYLKYFLMLTLLVLCASCAPVARKSETPGAMANPVKDNDAWLNKISRKHPRIFINEKIWPAVKKNCLENKELNKLYLELKARVDSYPENPSIETDKKTSGVVDGKVVKLMAPKYWGREAIETAFVYLMTKEKKYLDKTKKMLIASGKSYDLCLKQGMAGGDYHHSEFPNAFAAYDWIFNDLSEEERKNILLPMMEYAEKIQNVDIKKVYLLSRTKDPSRSICGFYGAESILWYSGLAGYNDGINDKLALAHLKKGYELNNAMLNAREKIAGKDGGFVVSTAGYSLGMYLWADINFFLTWRSATGENIAGQWKHFRSYPLWAAWALFPAYSMNYEYGLGDARHRSNRFAINKLFFLNIADLLSGDHPRTAELALYLYRTGKGYSGLKFFPVNIFLLSSALETKSDSIEEDPFSEHARLFESLGVAFMRSGSGPDATYCAFVTGQKLNKGHSHYDQGHFSIYKNGFLALDTGSRGRGASSTNFHIKYYYPQTVAHNSILIHMPNEKIPPHWGPKFTRYEGAEPECDGGQCDMSGGNCLAFESNDFYTYIAEDATKCYSDKKCGLVLRQFLFIYPNYFVIFDKVVSLHSEYSKEWLFHSHNEPKIDSSVFSVDEGEGRLFCKTLLPEAAQIKKIGGVGKEYWASGKNWPLESEFKKALEKSGKVPYMGRWRVSVSPVAPEKENYFLHLLEVGKKSELKKMVSSEYLENPEAVGCEFRAGGLTYKVEFDKKSLYGGGIKISRGNELVFEKKFSREKMEQRNY